MRYFAAYLSDVLEIYPWRKDMPMLDSYSQNGDMIYHLPIRIRVTESLLHFIVMLSISASSGRESIRRFCISKYRYQVETLCIMRLLPHSITKSD
jgi:hypothetical protein